MRWKPKAKADVAWKLPVFRPIVLDDGTRVLWEWVQYSFTITREWGGMGADGYEGYFAYWDRNGNALGRRTVAG